LWQIADRRAIAAWRSRHATSKTHRIHCVPAAPGRYPRCPLPLPRLRVAATATPATSAADYNSAEQHFRGDRDDRPGACRRPLDQLAEILLIKARLSGHAAARRCFRRTSRHMPPLPPLLCAVPLRLLPLPYRTRWNPGRLARYTLTLLHVAVRNFRRRRQLRACYTTHIPARSPPCVAAAGCSQFSGPISPNRGVRRGPQRLGGSVTLRSKTANPQ
jgi:hypothetical protein